MKHKRITSKKTIQDVRKPYCEICGQRTNIEPHHINTRGSGGGDIKENLIQLCTQCHINTHSGQYPTKDDCLNKVAEREGITYDEAYAINRRAMGYDVWLEYVVTKIDALTINMASVLQTQLNMKGYVKATLQLMMQEKLIVDYVEEPMAN